MKYRIDENVSRLDHGHLIEKLTFTLDLNSFVLQRVVNILETYGVSLGLIYEYLEDGTDNVPQFANYLVANHFQRLRTLYRSHIYIKDAISKQISHLYLRAVDSSPLERENILEAENGEQWYTRVKDRFRINTPNNYFYVHVVLELNYQDRINQVNEIYLELSIDPDRMTQALASEK